MDQGTVSASTKKGDMNNVDNYRGIMLTSIFSKICSRLLDNRLRKWIESNNILTESQFRFRQNKSTVDCIFVLQSIIQRVIQHEKRKLYCAFIAF